MSCAVNSVSGAYINAQLDYPFTHRLAVAKIAELNPTKSLKDARLRFLISQTREPFVERALTPILLVNDQLEHGAIVA